MYLTFTGLRCFLNLSFSCGPQIFLSKGYPRLWAILKRGRTKNKKFKTFFFWIFCILKSVIRGLPSVRGLPRNNALAMPPKKRPKSTNMSTTARGNNERSARPKKTPKGAQSSTRSSSSGRRSSTATSSSSSSHCFLHFFVPHYRHHRKQSPGWHWRRGSYLRWHDRRQPCSWWCTRWNFSWRWTRTCNHDCRCWRRRSQHIQYRRRRRRCCCW